MFDTFDVWVEEQNKPQPTTKVSKNDDDLFEVLDEHGVLIALVDQAGEVVWDINEEDDPYYEDGTVSCPNCGETRYIIDSSFPGHGDAECARCGCVFLSSVAGKDSIIMYNIDTAKFYEEANKEGLY